MTYHPSVSALTLQWRETADLLRSYGAVQGATATERCAQDLENRLQHAGDETLTPKQAAKYSGHSPGQLRRLMERRELNNYGGKHARYRRSELPLKAGGTNHTALLRDTADQHNVPLARTQIARAVVNGH